MTTWTQMREELSVNELEELLIEREKTIIRDMVRIREEQFRPGHVRAWLPVPAECDADNRTLTTDAPLQLMLLAADDPDRLVICFEYFFRDNSDLVHMVPDETFRGTEDSSSGH